MIKIFEEKAGFEITVDIEYVEPAKEKEKKLEIFKFPSKQKDIQKQENISMQNKASLQKTGTEGNSVDIPFDAAAEYYVDDMAYAATNMGFDIPPETATDGIGMGFDISQADLMSEKGENIEHKDKENKPAQKKTVNEQKNTQKSSNSANSSKYSDKKYGKNKYHGSPTGKKCVVTSIFSGKRQLFQEMRL